jgi:2-aminoadipate transaminase
MELEAIAEMNRAVGDPDIISLSGGNPAPEVFPMDLIRALADKVLQDHGRSILEYSPAVGLSSLREALAGYMSEQGTPAAQENIMITHGSQQVTDLLGKILLEPGDLVAVEDPTFLGALQAFNSYQVEYVTIPCDDDGPIPDALDELLKRHRVKLVYLVPTFQNPSGFVVPLERRKQLADITARHETLVLEDDPYGRLRYRGEELPFIKASDTTGNIIYTSTFSKLLAPGLRIGWLVADAEIIRPLTSAQEACDQHTNGLGQAIACGFLEGGHLEKHLPMIIQDYSQKLDAMCESMDKYFPSQAMWEKPEGGMFVWVEMPEGIDMGELYPRAIERGVAFVPGKYFYVKGGGENTMRLNFSFPAQADIVAGIERLGMVLKEALTG